VWAGLEPAFPCDLGFEPSLTSTYRSVLPDVFHTIGCVCSPQTALPACSVPLIRR